MPGHSIPPALGYSYIRFSSPQQAKGDSLRRQTEAAAGWCERNAVTFDTSTTLHDLGKSAYTGEHRRNPDRHALAAFLKLVEAGKIPRGSYLIIENLDRLSREHIQPALLLALNLLQAGIRVVQLKPAEMVFDDKSDTLPVMMMMMELARGHGESAMKSERVGKAWRQKKAAARNGVPLGERLPAWVQKDGNKLALIPEKAAAVKELFRLAASGYGIPSIIARLERENVTAIGRTGKWTRSYVGIVLKDRRALGEYQPRRGAEKDGDVIKDYYPAVVTEAEFHAARAGARERLTRKGRLGVQEINIFAGLLRNAREGDTYIMTQRLSKSPGRPPRKFQVLVNTNSDEGRSRAYSIPYLPFEEAALSRLKEINPHEILNGDSGPDESLVLAGELARVEAALDALNADMDEHGESLTLMKRVRDREAEMRALVEKLAEAKQKAVYPLSEAWGEAQTLADVLNSAPDPRDVRLRLRSALRRIVEGVWLLVIRRGQTVLAAVQIWFTGGKRHRDYLILYRPASAPAGHARPATSWGGPLSTVAKPGELDLRKPAHAARLEAALSKLDVTALDLGS